MTSQSPNPESPRPSVRQTVWPWDAPTAVSLSRPLWIRIAIQLAVMITLAGLFHLIGYTVMSRILMGLAPFGEPIVCTPEEAYRCFMRTEMDVLVMGSFLLYNEEQPPRHETREWKKDLVLD